MRLPEQKRGQQPRLRQYGQPHYRQNSALAKEWQQRLLKSLYATFPQTEIQNCIIHQLRSSGKYVSCKNLKALMADLNALDTFGERWDKKYPKISQS